MIIANQRILLLGKNGQLGQALTSLLQDIFGNGHVFCLDRTQLDITNETQVLTTLTSIQPTIVINATAYTAVDLAEKNPALAYQINSNSVATLAKYSAKQKILLIHYSTDYVFDGNQNTLYTEEDEPKPLSIYGKSKLLGEKAIQKIGCNHFIFRTSWLYSTEHDNFLTKILHLASCKPSLSVVADQIGTPNSAERIAKMTLNCLVQYLQKPISTKLGVYHVSCQGQISWFDYAKYIIEFATKLNFQLRLNTTNLLAINSDDYHTLAKRPKFSGLATNKLENNFTIQIPHWSIDVEQTLIALGKID